jgi:hypothetical protein
MNVPKLVAATILVLAPFASRGHCVEPKAVLDAVDSGWYRLEGSAVDHMPDNRNFLAGDTLSKTQYRDFFVFDLSAVPRPIKSATFRAFVAADGIGISHVGQVDTWSLFDVTTGIQNLVTAATRNQTFADLGSGVNFGSLQYSAADRGRTITVSLNDDALADMNAATGLWAFGGAVINLTPDTYQFIFSGSGPQSVPQLEINIPEPPSCLLAISALIASAIAWARRSRSATG